MRLDLNRILKPMNVCVNCNRKSQPVSATLGLCRACILSGGARVEERLDRVHRASRREFDLPEFVPQHLGGLACPLCGNACQVAEGERGFCAVRRNDGGRWAGARAGSGYLSWYHDPLPTNCVADWVCPAGTAAGYPEVTNTQGPEYGFKNLAVFYEACSFNCLFCQNWHFRRGSHLSRPRSAGELAAAVDPHTRCICYFGGDPAPQLPHAVRAAALARKQNPGRILRICWETNGSMAPKLLGAVAETALDSGGCIKFDLKAYDDSLHRALTGVSNRRTLENFQALWELVRHRPLPPPLVASTLLVPGYVTPEEVERIARFIAACDPDIPYALLAFHPHFYLSDLPTTSRSHAEDAIAAAKSAGLRRVRVGNLHLLR
jgi:pyruvate formate lyase activating enzyme